MRGNSSGFELPEEMILLFMWYCLSAVFLWVDTFKN